jgi:hypothetical protein
MLKESSPIDIDSAMDSFVSAQEEFDQKSTDSAVSSEILYDSAMDKLGPKPSANDGDNASANDSNDSSDEQPENRVQRRRHNISSVTTSQQRDEQNAHSDLEWKLKRMLWKTDRSTAVETSLKSSLRQSPGCNDSSKKGVIHEKQQSWQERYGEVNRNPVVEKQNSFQREIIYKDLNGRKHMEFSSHHSSRVALVNSQSPPTVKTAKQGKETYCTLSPSTMMSEFHTVRPVCETTRRQSSKDKFATNSRNHQRSKSKEEDVILIPDEDDTKAEPKTSDDDSVLFVSETKRKQVQTYVPVDNSIFVAYQRTNEMMRMKFGQK